uniref:Uncharacterized protein n=1 Tax=Oryzias latipes TaxID=8090 RepID=A0A3B3IG82_ORYLA
CRLTPVRARSCPLTPVRARSCRLTPVRARSCRLTPVRARSCRLTPVRARSCPLTPVRARSCPLTPVRARSCRLTPVRARSCRLTPVRARSCRLTPVRARSCPLTPVRARSCPLTPVPARSCPLTPVRARSCRLTPWCHSFVSRPFIHGVHSRHSAMKPGWGSSPCAFLFGSAVLSRPFFSRKQQEKDAMEPGRRGALYMLKTRPSLWTERKMLPDSRSSSFKRRPTCSANRTSQNTQTSARSLWRLALQVGSLERRTGRFRNRHTWNTGEKEREMKKGEDLNEVVSFRAPSTQGGK